MTSFFDKLNLRPGERRLVVFVFIIVFIVVNAFFVWPKFFEWRKVAQRRSDAEKTLHQFRREIDNTKRYQLELQQLEAKGASVASEDQASKLQSTVYAQGQLSGVTINDYRASLAGASSGKTNIFFDEQTATIQFLAEERNLVDFLYNLGAGGSLIRVRSMTLNPDPPRYRLQGSITFVASFARRAPLRPVTGTAAALPGARTNTATLPRTSMTNVMRSGATNAPVRKESWLSRLWPFGKKSTAPQTTNSPAKTNAPSKK